MARLDALLAAARAAGLAIWAEGDLLVVRGPASAAPIASKLHEDGPAVLALLAATELRAVFPGPDGPPTTPCCACGSAVRLGLADRHVGWLAIKCTCGHRGYMRMAEYGDWRRRHLRMVTAPTRIGRPFPAVVTAV